MNQHDIEQLSTYLDGGLKPSDSARLETRLASDPALASTLDALRASRSLLRRLPKRRAPRNFTLTRKMVGLKPPLPRSYPVFKFATVFAAFLFALSFIRLPSMAFGAAAPMPNVALEADVVATEEALVMESALAATEAPATEAPVEAYATEPPALAPLPTDMANVPSDVNPEGEGARVTEDTAGKSAPAPAPPLFTSWQIALGIAAILGVATMLLLRFLAARKWK
jgi:anti-sigma factor RsiW